ncbi:MAG: VIT1/CCC1 transporter family protein [Spirochaetales bacterium]|nr:VIT1/CCC1 transporter family protein [Spirochaetales bacterium]
MTHEAIIRKMQKNEITEYHIYSRIASSVKHEANKKILLSIAEDERRHYNRLKELTGTEIRPNRIKVWFYYIISLVLGISFGLKLMENGESIATRIYADLSEKNEFLRALSMDEQKHEKELLGVLSEERLEYAGSIILGLNDALVELTGALAGLTLALQKNDLIALAGLVTGFAASLSMAASGYLSSKEEADRQENKNPLKAALYTGVAYVITVILLIFPYFLGLTPFAALALTLAIALCIIFLYTFYITTAKGIKFWRRFLEMAVISLTIAAIGFLAGLGLKHLLGVDV